MTCDNLLFIVRRILHDFPVSLLFDLTSAFSFLMMTISSSFFFFLFDETVFELGLIGHAFPVTYR